jgi:hypothetical protein
MRRHPVRRYRVLDHPLNVGTPQQPAGLNGSPWRRIAGSNCGVAPAASFDKLGYESTYPRISRPQ